MTGRPLPARLCPCGKTVKTTYCPDCGGSASSPAHAAVMLLREQAARAAKEGARRRTFIDEGDTSHYSLAAETFERKAEELGKMADAVEALTERDVAGERST